MNPPPANQEKKKGVACHMRISYQFALFLGWACRRDESRCFSSISRHQLDLSVMAYLSGGKGLGYPCDWFRKGISPERVFACPGEHFAVGD